MLAAHLPLSAFIAENLEPILAEWEAFARTQLPAAASMTASDLQDHARQILDAIVLDLGNFQSDAQRDAKAKGLAPARAAEGASSAAATHGSLREASGFTLEQLTGEYRALRASVMRLWQRNAGPSGPEAVHDLMRFNEAIDQALAESLVRFSAHTARTRDTFLAMLGHDLRGPLASMSMAGEYLTRPEARKGDISAMGERVRGGAATMTAMVHDLLEYARTQLGGTMPLKMQPADLRETALASLRDASASHPGCPFELEAAGDLEGEFDTVRIRQVITNLLTNAAQYRDKSYRVTLSLLGEAERLVVGVKNRGPVIPPNAVQAIFNPLVQLATGEAFEERPPTSMGLGLFIAREITDAHGGAISVTSTEKDGTTFTVKLPRRAADADRGRFAA